MSLANGCCLMMAHALIVCDGCPDPWACPDTHIVRTGDGRLALPVRDGGRSMIEIKFCPWCGKGVGSS